jgi:hypothetical protein
VSVKEVTIVHGDPSAESLFPSHGSTVVCVFAALFLIIYLKGTGAFFGNAFPSGNLSIS